MMTKSEFFALPIVRISYPAGPCLTDRRLVRRNSKTCTVAFRSGSSIETERVKSFRVHTEPCPCCMDHPETCYPDGYLN
jgi:hypothetical protein